MNTIEAINAIYSGKKIKHTSWKGGKYLHKVNNMICDEFDLPHPLKSFHDNWEIYIEDTRKDLPAGINYITKLYDLIQSDEFNHCGGLTCNECPLHGTLKPTKCSLIAIGDMLDNLNEEYKIGELN